MSDTCDSTANLVFVGARGYDLVTTGATSNRYAVLDPTDPDPYMSCALAFADPSNDLVQAMREIMFRTAVAAANSSDKQALTAH